MDVAVVKVPLAGGTFEVVNAHSYPLAGAEILFHENVAAKGETADIYNSCGLLQVPNRLPDQSPLPYVEAYSLLLK